MHHFKSAMLPASVILSAVLTSPSVTADHNNPLLRFKPKHEPNQSISDARSRCEQDGMVNGSEPLCEDASNDTPIFESNPILSISTQIDIRPENCISFFDDYLHTRRGLRIESALNTTDQFSRYEKTVATFPVVDFISGKQAHVVKSKDISAQIYTSEAGSQPLYDSIIADAKEIETRILAVLKIEGEISATVHGRSTTLLPGGITAFTLHIIIQAGMASPNQVKQIELAALELKRRWGVQLAIIEIP